MMKDCGRVKWQRGKQDLERCEKGRGTHCNNVRTSNRTRLRSKELATGGDQAALEARSAACSKPDDTHANDKPLQGPLISVP